MITDGLKIDPTKPAYIVKTFPDPEWNQEVNIERALTAYGFALRNGNDPAGDALLDFLDRYKVDLGVFEDAIGDCINQENDEFRG